MRASLSCGLTLALGLCVAPMATADIWDNFDNTDDGTQNELTHGTSQSHDFAGNGGAQDEDWYRVRNEARSGYEVQLDSFGGDLQSTFYISVQRFADDGTTVLPNAAAAFVGAGYQFSLRWRNTTSAGANNKIRVMATNTATNNSLDRYTIRHFETNIAVPRYNNTSGQLTVLICQNPATYTVNGTVYLWQANGTLATSFNMGVSPKNTSVTNLATVNSGAANNTSGAITIAQDGRFGDLTCKSVALEAATGFSFDSPGLYKPL